MRIKKIGHAGTLDPLASGLMIIGVGTGTKQLAEFIKLDKEYIAEVLIGRQTTTSDQEGKIVAEKAVAEIFLAEKISATLTTRLGKITLPISIYSAIKKAGVPMYKQARKALSRGEELPKGPIRTMYIYQAKLISTNSIFLDNKQFQLCTICFYVASGTYIRSLAEELGRRLGYPASLYNLRRTKVGKFDIKEAKSLRDFASLISNPKI